MKKHFKFNQKYKIRFENHAPGWSRSSRRGGEQVGVVSWSVIRRSFVWERTFCTNANKTWKSFQNIKFIWKQSWANTSMTNFYQTLKQWPAMARWSKTILLNANKWVCVCASVWGSEQEDNRLSNRPVARESKLKMGQEKNDPSRTCNMLIRLKFKTMRHYAWNCN